MSSRLLVGIDLVVVRHIADSVCEFGERFLNRIFTPAEIDYCRSRAEPASLESFAARFAAKEATIKALGLADEAVDFRDIEVERTRNGACLLKLHGSAADAAIALSAGPLSLSLSHVEQLAVAIVIGERRNGALYPCL